ncbi:PAS domain S-box-containing protein [Krasilnikovia cinnamomea]|uniref:histidine kinase n=1 Tax=Krasilnikovia cinnamomea TaxID=349313 RepID=A0A4Q7ZNU0_9ACTN|nr:PAS domain-containing sensor histidine kinase [Krasilnikovia cinnamomea]RZU52163.1 PAS domain S-box-containing protein [Krasilnikovia cinnamomea]
MRYAEWQREHGSLTHGWWRVGVLSFAVLIIIMTSLVDLATPRELTAFGLVIVAGPVLAAASARPWAVAAVGAFAWVMAWATSSWQGLGGTAYQQVRLWVIAGMSVLSVIVAYGQRALERRANRSAEDESMLAAIVESSGDAIISIDREGIILSWNRSAERMYGYTAAEMIGQSVLKVLPPAAAARLPKIMSEILNGGGISQLRTQRLHKDGHLFDVSTSISPIFDRHGTAVGMAAIARDISAVKRAQDQREQILERSARAERLESLGQLAGGIAHDFNNLLAINLNYLEFALEQTTDPDTHHDLTRAKASAERARDLTRQLLVFARKQPTTAETIDLNTVITETRTLLDRTIGANIELITHLHPQPLPIRADRARLEQALLNLAINARDAMPDGGMIIIESGTTTIEDSPHPQAHLNITDTGTGMPPDIADHAFEPFFTTRTQEHGTGLGLATVYGIVTEAGGTITLTTKPGVGTTFHIELPFTGMELPATTETADADQLRLG